VQESGGAEPEGANELRSDAGGGSRAGGGVCQKIVVARENDCLAGIEAAARRDEAKACKAGREAAQSVGLCGDKGLDGGRRSER